MAESIPEIAVFDDIWEGGYFEGDPLSPVAVSSYGRLGFVSVLFATYLSCIRPYLASDSAVLEIGPGRGAWTKCMLGAREVWAVDVRSAERNGFWRYVGKPPNVRYLQVSNYGCSELPDNYFDFLFSYGCFCHIPPDRASEYLRNIFPKLKSGARCFVMVSDYRKFNRAIENFRELSIDSYFVRHPGGEMVRRVARVLRRFADRCEPVPARYDLNEDSAARPMRWFHLGAEEMSRALRDIGYLVVEQDVGVNVRDPILHFTKP